MGHFTFSSCCPNLFKKRRKDEREPGESEGHKSSPYAAPTIQTSKCSRAFNDTCYWRRRVLKAAKPYKDEEIISAARSVNDKEYLKLGTAVQLAEAAALRYVAENTSIPVPKVYWAFRHDNMTYILMSKIDGEEIGLNWEKRTDAENQNLLNQLKVMFEELRNIPHPKPGVLVAADRQALFDPRTYNGSYGFGPFANEQDFNTFLHAGMQRDHNILKKECNPWVTDEERSEMQRLLDLHDKCKHKICFTHGDASSSNILIKGDRVVGLIDFEVSGFYPEYWEYTTAMGVNSSDGFWRSEIPKFMKSYPEELEMEELRKEYFGPLGFRAMLPWG